MDVVEIEEKDAPPAERRNRKSRAARMVAVKRARQKDGALACEVCGWQLPERLNSGSEISAVHGHHVVPVQCGGTDEQANVLFLCPNHHCVAHRLGRVMRRGGRRIYCGPTTREAMVEAIRRVEDPNAPPLLVSPLDLSPE